MKTVWMDRDFSYRVKHTVFVQYNGGRLYSRVPEAAVKAIVAASAGSVMKTEVPDERP